MVGFSWMCSDRYCKLYAGRSLSGHPASLTLPSWMVVVGAVAAWSGAVDASAPLPRARARGRALLLMVIAVAVTIIIILVVTPAAAAAAAAAPAAMTINDWGVGERETRGTY